MILTPTHNGNKIDGEFYPLQKEELIALRRSRLINNAAFVHLALRYENPFCAPPSGSLRDRPIEIIPKQFAFRWGIPESSVYEAIAKLKKAGALPDCVKVKTKECIESDIRDHLHRQLGGLTEVCTPVGFIDLLTETEIIEVKNIKDWKSALGQILTYSAYYPNHRKRIHLFGETLDKLPDIESACLPFNVIVTGEEVKNG